MILFRSVGIIQGIMDSLYERSFDRAPKKEEDIRDPQVQRERLWSQDPRILEAVYALVTKIRSCPHDLMAPELEPRAFLVGGFVRDALLGKMPHDADLEVYGMRPARLEALLKELFPGKVDLVGRSFGIIKVAISPEIGLDVSIPRRESKTGNGHTDFVIQGDPTMSMEEACRRRDFTVNALAADPFTGEIFDYFGGVKDLKSGVLRATDEDRFPDDALRVYRALQFCGRMHLRVDPKTMQLMRSMISRGQLNALKTERITGELKKMFLQAERPSVGFELARDLRIIEQYFPELHSLIDCPQEPESATDEDAWTNTMRVLDAAAKIANDSTRAFSAEERLHVTFGALVHDLMRPEVVKSFDEEAEPDEVVRKMLARLQFGDATTRAIQYIVEEHRTVESIHDASQLAEDDDAFLSEKDAANTVRQLLKRISPTSGHVLLAVAEAKFQSGSIPGSSHNVYEPGHWATRLIEKYRLDVDPTKPLLQGRDLFEMAKTLGITFKSGPLMGQLIKKIEMMRDEGTVSTRDEAIEALRKEMLQLSR